MTLVASFQRLQLRLHQLLEARPRGGILSLLLASLIALNLLAFVLASLPNWPVLWDRPLAWLQRGSLFLFALEYGLRLWVCPLDARGLYHHRWRGRLRYLLSPLALCDLLAWLPALLGGPDLRVLRLPRLLWLLRLDQALPALGTLGRVLTRERRTLLAVLLLMLGLVLVVSSLVYLFEHAVPDSAFSSVPQTIWWGMTTVTTVGYGDLVPITPGGRVLGALLMLFGIATFALPAGILASAFAEERRRRDFIHTWNLVARVPWFAQLSAREIADIAALLHPRELLAGEVLFRRGDEADSMYFVVSGEVEVELTGTPIRLRRGEHFGEVGLVYHQPRSATVVGLQHSELLELYAHDLHALLEQRPGLRAQVMELASRRHANTPDASPELPQDTE